MRVLDMAKGKVPKLKIFGSADNSAFLIALGQLVIAWSNNESLFLAILQALMHDSEKSALIVWRSHRNTRNRIKKVRALAAEKVSDSVLLERLDDAIKHFNSLSGTRNFYCHAMYDYAPDLILTSATGGDDAYGTVRKPMNLGTLNEIQHVTELLHKFNVEMWGLVRAVDSNLGLKRDDIFPGLAPG